MQQPLRLAFRNMDAPIGVEEPRRFIAYSHYAFVSNSRVLGIIRYSFGYGHILGRERRIPRRVVMRQPNVFCIRDDFR